MWLENGIRVGVGGVCRGWDGLRLWSGRSVAGVSDHVPAGVGGKWSLGGLLASVFDHVRADVGGKWTLLAVFAGVFCHVLVGVGRKWSLRLT